MDATRGRSGNAVDSNLFRDKADRCRLHAVVAAEPAVKEQLRVWAREFDEIADEIEEGGELSPVDET